MFSSKRRLQSEPNTENGENGHNDDEASNKVVKYNEPIAIEDLPLHAGICTMLRLPWVRNSDGLDACFVGIPIDHGTSYKTGSRLAPRYIRMESAHIRKFNVHTGADPFSSIQVADIGDIHVNMYNLKKCCEEIRVRMDEVIKNGCRPLVMGGDHTLSYPFLQSLAKKYGPVAMVHIDSHSDCNDTVSGEKITHGTPFARAIDENLLDCKRVFQIGIRGSLAQINNFEFQKKQGFHVVPAKDCWYKSMAPLMKKVREVIGDRPTYISFDIDGLDPSCAPGTAFREIGGLTTSQAQEIIQGCNGLNVVGADMVEVCPAMDNSGLTSETAARLLFEILCILPGVKYHKIQTTKEE